MSNEFSKQMSKRTNAELIKILHEHRKEYQPEAIIAAETEFNARNLTNEQISDANDELESKRKEDRLKANEPLEIRWKIRTALFPGILQLFYSKTFINEGYERKAKELVRWTMYGFIFYFCLIFIIMLIG